jgi:hypothetical protein
VKKNLAQKEGKKLKPNKPKPMNEEDVKIWLKDCAHDLARSRDWNPRLGRELDHDSIPDHEVRHNLDIHAWVRRFSGCRCFSSAMKGSCRIWRQINMVEFVSFYYCVSECGL